MKITTMIAAMAVTGVCCAQEFAEGVEQEDSLAPAEEVGAETGVEDQATEEPQEFVQSEDGAMAAEQAALDAEADGEAKSAMDRLNDLMSTKYADADSAADRIVVLQKIVFDVTDPEVGQEFVLLRASKMAELLLQAKVQIAQTIFSRMSAEQILEKPYSPVADKFKNEMAELDKELKIAYKNLQSLGVEYEQAKLEKNANLTPSERAAIIGNWMGIANEQNLALQLDVNKKKKFDAATKKYQEAIAKFEQLRQEAESMKPQILKEMKSNMSRCTEMQMHGGVVLQQAEEYSEPDENGKVKCTMAIIYSWSEETQNAAAAVLSGKPLKLNPNGKKRSLRQWLDAKAQDGSLGEWLGPRRYIDNNGDLWFVGIAAAPTYDEAYEQETAEQIAELKSAVEVGFALYADISAKKTLEEAYRETKTDPNGPMTAKVAQAYSEKLQQNFKDLPIFGLKKVYTKTLKDNASGQDVTVIVSAVNASNASAMKGIQAKAHKLGIDINKGLQEERGRQDRMQEQIRSSRTDAASYNKGRRQADKELRDHNRRAKAPVKKPVGVMPAPKVKPAERGKIRQGVRLHIDED